MTNKKESAVFDDTNKKMGLRKNPFNELTAAFSTFLYVGITLQLHSPVAEVMDAIDLFDTLSVEPPSRP